MRGGWFAARARSGSFRIWGRPHLVIALTGEAPRGGALVRAVYGVGGGCCAARACSGSFRIWGRPHLVIALTGEAPRGGALVRAVYGVGGGCCAARACSGSFRIWGAPSLGDRPDGRGPPSPPAGASPGEGASFFLIALHARRLSPTTPRKRPCTWQRAGRCAWSWGEDLSRPGSAGHEVGADRIGTDRIGSDRIGSRGWSLDWLADDVADASDGGDDAGGAESPEFASEAGDVRFDEVP